MSFPKDTKPLIWGAISGAVLCIALGFTWGGWVPSKRHPNFG